MSLNTFLILVWWWDHFRRPYGHCENIFHTQKCLKMALFGPPKAPYKEKWPKNVIFHDFFKLLLNVPRCYPRYVEMFLRPLEGVLSLKTRFCTVSRPQVKWTFSAQILSLAQYWAMTGFGLKMTISPEAWKRFKNVFWGSKYLLRVQKTSLDTYNTI